METTLSGIQTQNQLLTRNLQKQTDPPKLSPRHTGDEVSIGMLTPDKTQALLNREIADKLKKYFDGEGIELKGLNAEDFTPEKVSDRILGFVSGRILSEDDSDEQKEMMAQARKGIEQGFAEAREILESLSVLNGKVKEDIDTTYDLIQKGLQRLENEVNGIPNEEDSAEQDESAVAIKAASSEHAFSRNESTKVEITTNDGDKILIELFKNQNAQSQQHYAQDENGSSFSQSRSISASAGISYEVQGELDEDEQKAIDDLLKDVAKVSDHFFSGNTQQAFKKAMDMSFDSEELTRISLDMSYQEMRSVAISTYGAVQKPQQDGMDEHHPEQAGLSEMRDFINHLDQVFQHPFVMKDFLNPEQGVGDLLKGMNQMLHSDEMKNLEKETSSLLDSIVHDLKEHHSLKSDEHSEKELS
ncbi:MAG: hypothetical protein GY694_09260 [Gammaproteobacteria bacterium]|nr:hypothetical protein [Gammaproteobacteria bacterium]